LNETIQGKIAIVTGAAGHLGQAVAKQLDQAGARLALFDRGEGRLEQLYPEWVDSGDHLLLSQVELTDPADVLAAVSQVHDYFERIDILVNTAGGYRAGDRLHETSDKDWDFMLDLNARTVLNATRAVLPHMLAQSYGKVVNIGARPGLRGTGKAGAYAASKSAVLRLTESMAAETKHLGINVNAVIPGTLDTPGNRTMLPDSDPEHWVSVEDLAKVILFLVSDEAKAIHGASVPVYGTG
jgi:NAD(P)-dependent dehydrogenase (short-subunit alcohol dehydrogenase family)